VPQPTGIAYDGQSLWVLGGLFSTTASMPPSTLVRVNSTTFAIEQSFTLNIGEVPGTGVGGIPSDL
jgi:hypothetical protein